MCRFTLSGFSAGLLCAGIDPDEVEFAALLKMVAFMGWMPRGIPWGAEACIQAVRKTG